MSGSVAPVLRRQADAWSGTFSSSPAAAETSTSTTNQASPGSASETKE